MDKITGKAIYEGIVIEKPYLRKEKYVEIEEYNIELHMLEGELQRLERAVKGAKEELKYIKSSLKGKVDASDLKILNVHLMILDDPVMISEMGKRLRKDLKNIEKIVLDVVEHYVGMFKEMKNPVYKQRAIDIRDVGDKILSQLMVSSCKSEKLHNKILITKDILPSELFQFHNDGIKLKGIITEYSGATSHVAILAKTFGIPTLMGVKDASKLEWKDSKIILDSRMESAQVIIEPTEKEIEHYQKEREILLKTQAENQRLKGMPALTKDKIEVVLNTNIGGRNELLSLEDTMADGIGLLRTEFLYMENKFFPTEEEQMNFYSKVYEKVENLKGEKELIIRTLDIGADKQLPYCEMPTEENPFLGIRGIRYTLVHKNIFKVQLRAILRVAKDKKIKMMFPMISTLDEVKEVNSLIEEVMKELEAEGLEYEKNIEKGIMLEVPSTVFLIEKFAKYVDFFSMGTNDLVQYIMAADRLSDEVAYLNDYFEPSVLRAIDHIAREVEKTGKKLSICGEMAGDPKAVLALMSLGVTRFSMLSNFIPRIKRLVMDSSIEELKRDLRPLILDQESGEDVKKKIKKYL